ncbi:hypothetical protein BDW59DRAFT_149062 [Aspergillus cavernicola]|uniref:Transfer RNA methyltransferase 82 n=1 Tax=Aspergillus cavernicola TaxID=176166 RepID=A0ABR4I606_9EURO
MAQNFQHPFQCIQFVKKKNGDSRNVLVASAGPKIFSYAAESGQRLSIWPQKGADLPDANDAGSNPENEGPPEKKRKVDPASEQTASAASGKKSATWTNIPILTSTPDGEYLVALTGEDKCIRVFQIEEDGSFQQISARLVPKRPCAITFMDNNDILTGDKFGDVYSMPLIPSADPRNAPKTAWQERAKKIAATSLTVHTQRNLRSLEMQRQRAGENHDKNKDLDKPTYDHDLLLGHVSLLTDVAFVSLSSSDPSSARKRSYILSADRDEHIRVSRGPPQAHIIENYCFGHTAFISKLCIPQWAPEILISGGGDPYFLVWNWTTGQILQKVPLVEETPEATKEVAVRSIWAASFGPRRLVLVALEGTPFLQYFTLETNGAITPHQPLKTSGNILDVHVREDINTVLISVDCIREPGSTQEWRSTPVSPATLLEAFQLKQDTEMPEWETVSDSMISTINASETEVVSATTESKEKAVLNNSLYGLEHLRKKYFGEDDA